MGKALGFVETRGLVAAIEASDAALKAAAVNLLELKFVGSGLVSVVLQGEVAAVQAAVSAGEMAARQVGEIISTNVIPNPHSEVAQLLPGE